MESIYSEIVTMISSSSSAAAASAARKSAKFDDVCIYRGGYKNSDRRLIESSMFRGDCSIIVGTCALELGVDIANIDVVIILGTAMGEGHVLQMGGRAGRKGRDGVVLQICFNGRVEGRCYEVPALCWGKKQGNGRGGSRDVYMDRAMLLCRSVEGGIDRRTREVFGNEATRDAVEHWSEKQHIVEVADGVFVGTYLASNFNRKVQIRNIEPISYLIVDEDMLTEDTKITKDHPSVLDSVSYTRVFYYSFPGAVILHRNVSYLVTSIDSPPRILKNDVRAELCVYVKKKIKVSYRTEPRQCTQFTIIKAFSQLGGSNFIGEGSMTIKKTVHGYRKVDKISNNEISRHEITLPSVEWETRGIWIMVDRKACLDEGGMTEEDLEHGMHALGHALTLCAPLFCLCDEGDIDCDHFYHNASRIVLYDAAVGSNGACNQLWRHIASVFRDGDIGSNIFSEAIKLLSSCEFCNDEFDLGCTACICQTNCHIFNQRLSRKHGEAVGRHVMKRVVAAREAELETAANEKVDKELTPRKRRREGALEEAKRLEVARSRQVVIGRPTWGPDGAKKM